MYVVLLSRMFCPVALLTLSCFATSGFGHCPNIKWTIVKTLQEMVQSRTDIFSLRDCGQESFGEFWLKTPVANWEFFALRNVTRALKQPQWLAWCRTGRHPRPRIVRLNSTCRGRVSKYANTAKKPYSNPPVLLIHLLKLKKSPVAFKQTLSRHVTTCYCYVRE